MDSLIIQDMVSAKGAFNNNEKSTVPAIVDISTALTLSSNHTAIYTMNVPIFSWQRMFASGSNLITFIVSKHEALPGNISCGPVYHFHSASLVIYKYCLGHLENLAT